MYSGKDLLDLENEDSVVFYLLFLNRDQPFLLLSSPCSICSHRESLGSQSGAYLSSASFPASVGGMMGCEAVAFMVFQVLRSVHFPR